MTDAVAAPEVAPPSGYVGSSVRRKEDKRLLEGRGVFFDDVHRHGMGYLHLVRSPYAHAQIASVDVSEAEALPGVYGTLSGDEVRELTDPFFEMSTPPADQIRDYALAVDKVRFAGEPVVAVVAETRECARDAADLVRVEYEPLEVSVDPEAAVRGDAPLLHEAAGTDVVWSGTFDYGDVDGALGAADHVLRIDRLHFDRFSSTPLECSGAIVEWDRASDRFTLTCNHQMPGIAAVWIAPALRVSTDQLRFVTHDVGGAFGNKATTHPYLVTCCLLARKLNRPIQWTEWRTEQLWANTHGNERTFLDVEVAVQRDGTMLGFKVRVIDDCGAYPRYEPLGCVIWAQVLPGAFRWRHMRVDFTQVCTNKAPAGPNRGYSRQQQAWFCERLTDIVAVELDLDPAEVRRRNYVRADEMPYETPNGCVYDSGDYERCLDMALELVDYEDARARQDERRDGKLLGIGIGTTLDSGTNNFGQSQILNPELQFSGNNEVASIKLDNFGEIVLTLGTVPQGQGHETSASQVAAEILGVAPSDVRVRVGHDTYWNSHAAFSGTYASQFAVTGLGAVKGAAEMLRAEMRELAAAVLGASGPDAISIDGGMATRIDDPRAQLPFAALGAIVNMNNAGLPEDLDVTLNCRYVYRPSFQVPDLERKFGNLTLTYALQLHACVVEIDPETGQVEIVDHAAVHDCGVQINPQIVEGQLHGGLAHAIGGALYECFAYDEDGQLLTTNFYDYHVPHAGVIPDVKVGNVESPSPFTPFGAKGTGEGGGCGALAIASAIQDALRHAGRGIVAHSFNPPERVLGLIEDPEATRAGITVDSP